MKTIILPGYSEHNRDWAYQIKQEMSLPDVVVHEWKHWQPAQTSGSENSLVRRRASGSARPKGSFSMKFELSELEKEAKEKVNIIAKSVGTRVAMEFVIKNPKKVNKLILCGIPVRWQPDDAKPIPEHYRKGLNLLDPNQIVIFQNKKDPFCAHEKLKDMIKKINKNIKIYEKPRSDHNYPYPSDFKKFLVS
jgi:predicted alpha/beta hydrolase family esterase